MNKIKLGKLFNWFKPPLTLLVLALSFFFLTCQYPTDPQKRNIIELESVWQFCKAYSLYSHRLQDHSALLSYNTPENIVYSLFDTLHVHWFNTTLSIARYSRSYESLVIGSLFAGKDSSGQKPLDTTVFFKKLSNQTAYVSLRGFALDQTDKELSKYDSMITTIPNIILDLRKNLGGYVVTCQNIVEYFLPANKPYLNTQFRLIDTINNNIPDTGTYVRAWQSTIDGNAWENKRVAVLIDSNTASAAEILAVALRDGLQNDARLIGRKSFGKAIGQIIFQLLNNAGIKLTTMKFWSISGTEYHEKGIEPDTIFTDPFYQELLYAGTWLEPDFINSADSLAIEAVLKFDQSAQPSSPSGCLRIAHFCEYP